MNPATDGNLMGVRGCGGKDEFKMLWINNLVFTVVLDGYLIGKAQGVRTEAWNQRFFKHLQTIPQLDGYLTGRPFRAFW